MFFAQNADWFGLFRTSFSQSEYDAIVYSAPERGGMGGGMGTGRGAGGGRW
ncbi:MAG: hypothetical protein WAS93_03095 [Burkholderiaceae bacterium]